MLSICSFWPTIGVRRLSPSGHDMRLLAPFFPHFERVSARPQQGNLTDTQNRKPSVSTTNTATVFRGLMNGRWQIKWKPWQKSSLCISASEATTGSLKLRSSRFMAKWQENSENGLQVPCSSRRYWCLLVAQTPPPCPQVPGRNLCFVLGFFWQQETSRKNLLSLPETFLYFKMATWNTGLALSHFKHFTRGAVFSGGKRGEEKKASFIVLSLTHLPTSILTLPTPRKALPVVQYLQGSGSWADSPGRMLRQWKISLKSSGVFLFPHWVRISSILFSAIQRSGQPELCEIFTFEAGQTDINALSFVSLSDLGDSPGRFNSVHNYCWAFRWRNGIWCI